MSTFISDPLTKIRTIKPGDRMFRIHGGIITSDRASIEIDSRCPAKYAEIILSCYNKGWVKPVAHVTEKEYVLLGLSND
jgi:hypothetical protein